MSYSTVSPIVLDHLLFRDVLFNILLTCKRYNFYFYRNINVEYIVK